MAKASFKLLDANSIIEIPSSLAIINKLTSSIEENDLIEEGSVQETYEESIDFLNAEIVKIFCNQKGLDPNDYEAEFLPLSVEEAKEGVEISVRLTNS